MVSHDAEIDEEDVEGAPLVEEEEIMECDRSKVDYRSCKHFITLFSLWHRRRTKRAKLDAVCTRVLRFMIGNAYTYSASKISLDSLRFVMWMATQQIFMEIVIVNKKTKSSTKIRFPSVWRWKFLCFRCVCGCHSCCESAACLAFD